MVKYFPLLFSLFYSLGCLACADDKLPSETNQEYRINWNAAADSSSSALIHLFWNADEHYFNYNNLGLKDFHYWPQAHALDVMVDAYLRTRDNLYKTTINDWYEGVKRKRQHLFQYLL